MEIKIKVDGDEDKEEVIFFNTGNPNFVDVLIGGKEYMFSLQDLVTVVEAFNNYKWEKI